MTTDAARLAAQLREIITRMGQEFMMDMDDYNKVVECAAELTRLSAENAALREALEKCRPYFRPDSPIGSAIDRALSAQPTQPER